MQQLTGRSACFMAALCVAGWIIGAGAVVIATGKPSSGAVTVLAASVAALLALRELRTAAG